MTTPRKLARLALVILLILACAIRPPVIVTPEPEATDAALLSLRDAATVTPRWDVEAVGSGKVQEWVTNKHKQP